MERAQILEAISSMRVLEFSQLIKDMEEKFGVSAAAAVAVAAPAAAAGGAAAAEGETGITGGLAGIGENTGKRLKGGGRGDEPGPEGSEKPGRRGAEAGEGGRIEGRGGCGCEEAD